MNILSEIGGAIDALWSSFPNIWQSGLNIGLDVLAYGFKELVGLGLTLAGAIPVPAALASFEWPVVPSVVGAVIWQCGIPEGMAILAAGYTIRGMLKLTIIFR